MNRADFRPLSRTLRRTFLVWAVACTLAISAVQALLIYRGAQADFETELAAIADTTVPLLSVLVWDIEPLAVQQQLDRLVQRPEIGHAVLQVQTGQTFEAGRRSGQASPMRAFRVPPPGRPEAQLATLHVSADDRTMWAAVARGALQALLSCIVLTLLLAGVVSWVLRRQVIGPLHQVARFAHSLTPEGLTVPLRVQRPRQAGADEIDLVVEGIGVLQQGLRAHIAQLDQRVAQRTLELEAALASIRRLSMVEPLSGCVTRQTFDERIVQEVQRAHRYGRALSLLFVDVDHFKSINDTHGHVIGDAAIAHVGARLRAGLRVGIDWASRYGGEEFVIVLPETGLDAACHTAERLRESLFEQPLRKGLLTLPMTVSIGVSSLRPGEDAQALLTRADTLVYQAKHAGRNCVRSQTQTD